MESSKRKYLSWEGRRLVLNVHFVVITSRWRGGTSFALPSFVSSDPESRT